MSGRIHSSSTKKVPSLHSVSEALHQKGQCDSEVKVEDDMVCVETVTFAHRILDVVFENNPLLRCTVRPEGYKSNVSKIQLGAKDDPLERRDVLAFLAEWAMEGKEPYCALLGELGMGKSTTCVLFARQMLQEYKNNPTLLLPIYLDLRNLKDKTIANELALTTLIEQVLLPSFIGQENKVKEYAEEVLRLVERGSALVIFDGLDEVFVHLSPMAVQQFARKVLGTLSVRMKTQSGTSRLLVTCRTHYFKTLREQNSLFTLSDRDGISSNDYRTIVLHPFGNHQIRDYLQRTVPNKEVNALLELLASVHNMMELAERPYTLSLIPQLIDQIESWKMGGVGITGVSIYRHMVQSWLHRDDTKHKFLVEHKLALMEYFAAELWRSKKTSWTIATLENWFVRFLQLHPEVQEAYSHQRGGGALNTVLEALKEDLRTATFLVRVGEAEFRFAHTSLLEFFLASYMHKALLSSDIAAWKMRRVSQETYEFLGQLLIQDTADSLEVAMESLNTIKKTYLPEVSEQALAYMIVAFQKNYPTVSCVDFCLDDAQLVEWNIEGIENKIIDFLDFQRASFRRANLKGSSFRHINLQNADFSEAQFSDGEAVACGAQSACFAMADLTGNFFMDMQFEGANFSQACINQTEWLRCNLKDADGLDFMPDNVVLSLCEPSAKFNNRRYIEGGERNRHQAVMTSCECSPDGKLLATTSLDYTLRLWSIETGECLKLFSHDDCVFDCAFFPDAQKIVTASVNNILQVWDIKTQECVQIFAGHEGGVRNCIFSPDSKQLVSVSDDKTIRIWNISRCECLLVLTGHLAEIRSCDFSPNGLLVASASDDRTIRIWSSVSGECLKVLTGHTDWVRKCVFSIDGHRLISASADKTLRVWDVITGECISIFRGHKGRVRNCAVSSDGKYVVSASYDSTLRVWDLMTGECLNILIGHQGRVRFCNFLPDGRRLVSASDDLTLRLWDIATGECLSIIGK